MKPDQRPCLQRVSSGGGEAFIPLFKYINEYIITNVVLVMKRGQVAPRENSRLGVV